ncbi:MAG: hypothetical protein K6B74_05650 [Ruminococcus sp.]|nr:hypothetical protein [Ruminococcus sp.]
MGRFEDHNNVTDADEINYFLNNAANADDAENAAAAAEEKRLGNISEEDTKAHSDALTIIIIAFVILFFGSVFTTLTNHQDMTEDTDNASARFGKFVEGSYFADIEKKFNTQLPLQDEFHNASILIKYCFGIDNSTDDLIDIESKRLADDPYSISQTNQYIPVNNNTSSEEGDDDGEVTKKTLPEVVTTSNNKNKKISGITLTTVTNENQMFDEEDKPMSVDRNAPPGNHDAGFNPYANSTETQPTETQTPITQPSDQPTETASHTQIYFTDPNRTQPSETEPVQSEPEQSGQIPQNTDPVTTDPPATTKSTNMFIIPAQGR